MQIFNKKIILTGLGICSSVFRAICPFFLAKGAIHSWASKGGRAVKNCLKHRDNTIFFEQIAHFLKVIQERINDIALFQRMPRAIRS